MSDQASFSRALLDPELDVPTGLSTWNRSDSVVRFAVYRNNVVVSLIDALADTFAVTQALVGEEFFRAMARVFLQTHPVTTRMLVWLGEPFADFLDAFAPVAALPYLSDVARLEMLRIHAYHAADAEPIGVSALAQALADPDALAGLKLTLHPSVQLLASRYAVYALWAAHQGALSIDTVNPDLPQSVLAFRSNLDVVLRELSAAESNFLVRLTTGDGLALATEAALTQDPGFDLGAFLGHLMRWQLITGISKGDITP